MGGRWGATKYEDVKTSDYKLNLAQLGLIRRDGNIVATVADNSHTLYVSH